MKPAYNDVFRLTSLRGPDRTVSVDPSEDVPDSDVRRRLADLDVDQKAPSPQVLKKLTGVRTLNGPELDGNILAAIDKALTDDSPESPGAVSQLAVKLGHEQLTAKELATRPEFADAYRAVVDSWLVLTLTNSAPAARARHVTLIRAGHLVALLSRDPATLAEPGAVRRLRAARIVTPRAWTPGGRRAQAIRRRQAAALATRPTPAVSDLRASIAAAEIEQEDLRQQIDILDGLQAKAHRVYVDWKRTQLAARPPRPVPPSPVPVLTRELRAMERIADRVPRGVSQATPRLTLDATYAKTLTAAANPAERTALSNRLGAVIPGSLDEVLTALDPGSLIDAANRLCRRIQLWEADATEQLPVGSSPAPTTDRPLVRAIGWGDLVVARERLIGYDAREIAHVENVMPGEERVREHERRRSEEQVIEVETTTETESQRDVQTTDRFELQSESESTINQQYSIQAGVNTSGRYGLTKVETSLQAGFQQSKSEARSQSQSVAREIVSKAIERTFERVRELRRTTVTEQIRELNTHRFQNVAISGGTVPADISGVYLWVEKLLEVELRQYGTRLLVEFHVPEPAISLIEQRPTESRKIRKPAPFTLSPADVHPSNYLCLVERFGAVDVQPPPSQFIDVGWAWASAPSEDVNEDTAEDTVADTIAIPAGYRPMDGRAIVSAHPAEAQYVDVYMAVGGTSVIDLVGDDFEDGDIAFDPSLAWPNGVPVSVRAHGHFDKTLVAQVFLRCQRTDEALAAWRLRTWEALRTAHEALMQGYRAELQEQQLTMQYGAPPVQRPEAENRRIEREELRKWAIKAMRLAPFDFNAVEQVGDFQEIDPLNGDLQASLTRLFEEAFEWDEASYFLYPYYWGRRDTWALRMATDAVDPRHSAFLRAGAARFIVPVTPGYEERVLYYLDSDPAMNELDRLAGPPDGAVPADTDLDGLWLELLLDRKPEVAMGSGTLAVVTGQTRITINPDSTWTVAARDVGRELYIGGEQYRIASIADDRTFDLDEVYSGATDPAARYAAGSVPYGPAWVVRVPTSLVILEGRRGDLASLGV